MAGAPALVWLLLRNCDLVQKFHYFRFCVGFLLTFVENKSEFIEHGQIDPLHLRFTRHLFVLPSCSDIPIIQQLSRYAKGTAGFIFYFSDTASDHQSDRPDSPCWYLKLTQVVCIAQTTNYDFRFRVWNSYSGQYRSAFAF